VQRILGNEGIHFLLAAQVLDVYGRSGEEVWVTLRTPFGEQELEGSDILVAAGAFPTRTESDSRRAASNWTLARMKRKAS
jgi:hypothetical protein